MSGISTNASTNAVKHSFFTRLSTLFTDFGHNGLVAELVNRHNQRETVTGAPQPAEPPPQADAVAENYYAYLPLFIP